MKRILFFLGWILTAACAATAADLKVGVIGLDTSHSVEFTRIIHEGGKNPQQAAKLQGLRVTAAYPQGSKDIPESVQRVPEYTEKMRALGVEIVDSLDALVERVDAVLLESNDGKVHWEQLQPVLKAKKPVFVDKPVAASLADCLRIYHAAEAAGVPIFSSSALRFGQATLQAREGKTGAVKHVEAYSPAHVEKSHPDLFWYGIHGVEPLFTVLGQGAVEVRRGVTEDGLIQVTGTWRNGSTGVFKEANKSTRQGYGGSAKSATGSLVLSGFEGYEPLVVAIADFFRTGKAPVSAEETLEIYAFMEAADESKRRGGARVSLTEVLAKAKAALAP